MITAKKNSLVEWFFSRYIINLVKKNFHAVKILPDELYSSKPVLLIANHFSWWDGFLLYYVNHLALKKKFHIMIMEETVKRFFFMKYLGAFSVSKGSRGAVETIGYAAELLSDPQNMVVIFPQGKLYSNFINEIHFEKGVLRILEKCNTPVEIVFAAAFIEHLEHKKPSANVYLKTSITNKYSNIGALTAEYQQHYLQCIQQQTQIVV